jgi:ribose 1,5-bisphosphokinase
MRPSRLPTFEQLLASNAFALHWDAHGLWHGVPISIVGDIARGRVVVALSVAALAAVTLWP